MTEKNTRKEREMLTDQINTKFTQLHLLGNKLHHTATAIIDFILHSKI